MTLVGCECGHSEAVADFGAVRTLVAYLGVHSIDGSSCKHGGVLVALFLLAIEHVDHGPVSSMFHAHVLASFRLQAEGDGFCFPGIRFFDLDSILREFGNGEESVIIWHPY